MSELACAMTRYLSRHNGVKSSFFNSRFYIFVCQQDIWLSPYAWLMHDLNKKGPIINYFTSTFAVFNWVASCFKKKKYVCVAHLGSIILSFLLRIIFQEIMLIQVCKLIAISVASLEGCDGCKCTRRFLRMASCTRQF